VGGPGRARGPRMRSKANLEACCLAGFALRATPAVARLREEKKSQKKQVRVSVASNAENGTRAQRHTLLKACELAISVYAS